MKPASALIVVLVALLAAGCLGSSSAKAPTSSAVSKPPRSAPAVSRPATPPALDAATRHRLIVEWRVAVRTSHVLYGPRGGTAFLAPRQLASAMRRAHPGIPATASFGPKTGLARRVVFVLSPTALELDVATVAADGRDVHLLAVGYHRPHFKFAAL